MVGPTPHGAKKLADLKRCDEVSQCQRGSHSVVAVVVSHGTIGLATVYGGGERLDVDQQTACRRSVCLFLSHLATSRCEMD